MRRSPVRTKILALLDSYWLTPGSAGTRQTHTATEVARSVGHSVASVSSILRKLVAEGKVVRVKGAGPRGGYGYRTKGLFERMMDDTMEIMNRRWMQEMDQLYFFNPLNKSIRGIV